RTGRGGRTSRLHPPRDVRTIAVCVWQAATSESRPCPLHMASDERAGSRAAGVSIPPPIRRVLDLPIASIPARTPLELSGSRCLGRDRGRAAGGAKRVNAADQGGPACPIASQRNRT